jgi:hypothetical protein
MRPVGVTARMGGTGANAAFLVHHKAWGIPPVKIALGMECPRNLYRPRVLRTLIRRAH